MTLLGIPGDNTYSNYQEANRTFWRQTVLPLVNRTAKALSAWLSPAFASSEAAAQSPKLVEGSKGTALELRPDLDAIEALSPEREALWARLEKAAFLTADEKRAAVGYGPVDGGDRIAHKANFNPAQLRVPAGQPGGGQWVREGGGDLVHLTQGDRPSGSTDRGRYHVDLKEEEASGGHTLREHVGKSDEELLEFARRDRHRSLFVTIARIRRGTFLSLESANDFVNRTLEENQAIVDRVASGRQDEAVINRRFGYVTGREAFRPDADSEPYMRNTYEVRVLIRHDPRLQRGYRVHTAFPMNRDPAR